MYETILRPENWTHIQLLNHCIQNDLEINNPSDTEELLETVLINLD